MSRSCRQLAAIKQAHAEWSASGRGERTATLERWGEILGISSRRLRDLFRQHGLVEAKEKTIRKNCRRYPHWEKWTEIIGAVKFSPDPDEGCLATVDAVRTALLNGMLPETAGAVPPRTWDRWMMELNIHNRAPQARRIRASEPNQQWYGDASRSKHFKVLRRLGGGDYLLEFQSRKAGPYANKPEREQGDRLWVYGFADDCSSLEIDKYMVARGENAEDFLRALDWAMARPAGDLIMRGRPLNLKIDNGPARKSLLACDAFMRCGIGLPPRKPNHSRGGGRVERPFRTLWQSFEQTWWPEARSRLNDGRGKLRLHLSELNEALQNYSIEYQHRPHPSISGMTRAQVWLQIAYAGLVEIAPGAVFSGYKQHTRKLDAAGWFSYRGKKWMVRDLHSCTVDVYEDIESNLFIRDAKGYGHKVRPAVEDELGIYRAQKAGRRDGLVAGLSGEITPIYSVPQAEQKVVAMPPRVTRTVEAKLPFTEPGTYRTVEEALSALIDRTGVERWRQFDEEAIGALRAHLEKDLTESAVSELARDLRAAIASA